MCLATNELSTGSRLSQRCHDNYKKSMGKDNNVPGHSNFVNAVVEIEIVNRKN
jgi:hypothetical protein